MKRLPSFIFIALLLCQDVSARQAKTNPNRDSNPPAPIVVEEQNTTNKSPEPDNKHPSTLDIETVVNQDPLLVERVKELAEKANWTLFWSILATIFAGLSWLTSRRGFGITKKATIAEYQPYVTFAKRLTLSRIGITYCEEVESRIIGASLIVTPDVINIAPILKVANKGKTPAKDFEVSYWGKVTNERIIRPNGERQAIEEVYEFSGRNIGPAYLGLDDERNIPILDSFHYKKDRANAPQIRSTQSIPVINASFAFEFIVSFMDEFSESRRAYIASYIGRTDSNWITTVGARELAETEKEYKKHYASYQSSLK